MLRFMATVLMAAVLVLTVHPTSAQEEAVDYTARGGLKDLLGRVDALEARPDADTLADLDCTEDQIAKHDGFEWVCATAEGNAVEPLIVVDNNNKVLGEYFDARMDRKILIRQASRRTYRNLPFFMSWEMGLFSSLVATSILALVL